MMLIMLDGEVWSDNEFQRFRVNNEIIPTVETYAKVLSDKRVNKLEVDWWGSCWNGVDDDIVNIGKNMPIDNVVKTCGQVITDHE